MIVILAALNLEHQAVRSLLSPLRRLDHPAGTIFEVGRPPGGRGLVALGVTGEGNTAAAILAERAIAMFRPQALIFVGVAGALRDDIALGDVVVATKVYAYHGGEVHQDGFRPRPRSWQITHQLDQLARRVHRAGSWRALLPAGQAWPLPQIHFSPVAAGEVVLKSRDGAFAERLRRTYGDAVAIEMEGAGVAQAAHLNAGLPVLSVRGISDRADVAKHHADSAGWQPIAAANAAAFAMAVAASLSSSTANDHQAENRLARLLVQTGSTGLLVPHQLPSTRGPLVGRVDHLSKLDEMLLRSDGQTARIAILTGMAGAGKTALAVHWAHSATEEFADGQLYVDVRGFGPDPPLQPREILSIFLRALGQSEGAELGGLEERAARFRTALNGRQLLLVLDNVGSVEQIRPLLPGSCSCAVLITSRERLRGLVVHHGARVLEVDRLAPADSVVLLRTAIGERAVATPELLAVLADRCAGLPLALRIAAERLTWEAGQLAGLASEPTQPGSPLDLLDTGDDPYSAVRTVFFWSYQALADPAARAFRLLGLHPGGDFSLPVAAALLDRPASQAKTILRTLVNAHLITPVATDRFGMHDLLRAYATELCALVDDDISRRGAVARMFDQYLHTADQADCLIMPHRYRIALDGVAAVEPAAGKRADAAHWFDLERNNLVDLCRLDRAELDSRRWQLAYVLRDYFYLSKHLDDWIETHRLAVAGCERLGDHRAEGMIRNNLGRALLEAGQPDAAAAQYGKARDLLEAAGDVHGVTDALVNMASILRHRGAYTQALRDQLAALAFYRHAGLERKIGITLRGIASTELALGRLADATEHAEEALAKVTGLGLDLDAAQALNVLARVHLRRGELDRAEAAGQRAIEHSRKASSDFEQARALHELGRVAEAAGQPGRARQQWTQALAIFSRLGALAAETVRSDLQKAG